MRAIIILICFLVAVPGYSKSQRKPDGESSFVNSKSLNIYLDAFLQKIIRAKTQEERINLLKDLEDFEPREAKTQQEKQQDINDQLKDTDLNEKETVELSLKLTDVTSMVNRLAFIETIYEPIFENLNHDDLQKEYPCKDRAEDDRLDNTGENAKDAGFKYEKRIFLQILKQICKPKK